jgi:hypothetical protein
MAARAGKSASINFIILLGLPAAAFAGAVWWLLRAGSHESQNTYETELIAALAGGVVLLLGLAARTRSLALALSRHQSIPPSAGGNAPRGGRRRRQHHHQPAEVDQSPVLSAIESKLAEAHTRATTPETHLEAARLCDEFIARANQSLARINLEPGVRNSLRARQERMRSIRKQHFLSWARGNSQDLIHQAQRRARVADRIEGAMAALEVVETALREYPHETELQESLIAIREYVASVRVRYWVELAERADFKGKYTRAIHRYENALFYLGRDAAANTQSKLVMEERIRGKIESLQARLELADAVDDALSAGS